MHRPFFSWSIIKLETEFDRAYKALEKARLEQVADELINRDTLRAQNLLKKAQTALGAMDGGQMQPLSTLGLPLFAPPTSPATIELCEKPSVPFEPISTVNEPPIVALRPVAPPQVESPRRRPCLAKDGPATERHGPIDLRTAESLLAAWTAIEVLSPPQTFSKPSNLVEGRVGAVDLLSDPRGLPWSRGIKARPNTKLFHQIIVGAIRMEEASAALLEAFKDNNVENVSARGFTPIAVLTVDSHGRPVDPSPLAISSFAWGLRLALARKLRSLGDWTTAEPKLLESAGQLLQSVDDDGQRLSIDALALKRLFDHLATTLAIPSDCLVPPEFSLRIYHYWQASEPPDPPPMGSFFLDDLDRARSSVSSGEVPVPLRRYLGISVPKSNIDLMRNQPQLAESLAPCRTPPGCWPARGGHPLVVLQQAAVNLAVKGDASTTLLPVNGPPGTGKSTLLRDLVAAVVVERARMLAKLENPGDAFASSGQKFKAGNAFTHHYTIAASLKGFEIVVASSNNKAVENISAELPALGAIDQSRPELRYFQSVASNVASGLGDKSLPTDAEKVGAWGLIAAVLGNARNRYAFQQAAWSDEDFGLRAYLMEASGHPQTIHVKDPKTGRIVEDRKPHVVLRERPPVDAETTLKRWRSARRRFLSAVARVEERLTILEAGRAALGVSDTGQQRASAQARVDGLRPKARELQSSIERCETISSKLQIELQSIQNSMAEHDRAKPGVWDRFLNGAKTSEWERRQEALANSLREVARRIEEASTEARNFKTSLNRNREDSASAERALAAALSLSEQSQAPIDRAVAIAGLRFADAAFFERESSDLHRDTAWLDAETQKLRVDVFVAAMELHRAFVDVSAKQIRNNLDLLFRTFFGRSAWLSRMRPLMSDLWATFFCVVPVVSTTFASMDRMFGYLDNGSLGWLLVDEAGQAEPQMAVGGLLRTQRAVIVGDPQQLPPVTSLPTELIEKIAEEFGVEPARFMAPEASVQSLSDAASPFGTAVTSGDRALRIGVPLVVHRRCAEPMFSLSNSVAYGGLMVQGRGPAKSKIRQILGKSAWFNVRPDRCEDKWSAAEGRTVIYLLNRLDQARLDELDIYIVSPFRIVAQKLRELLVADKTIARWTPNPHQWVKERVGTVYTVQGREADTVILVLGAAEPQRRGARAWAGQSVNQLNVAVTRAKENLYVVGNRHEWASAGKFAALERMFD